MIKIEQDPVGILLYARAANAIVITRTHTSILNDNSISHCPIDKLEDWIAITTDHDMSVSTGHVL